MAIIALIYLIFILFVVIAGIIIVFHLLRYSLDRRIARHTAFVFVIVTGIFILANVYFFTQIPFGELIPQTNSNPSF